MPIKVLHVNVDDQEYGGVFSLVRSIVASEPEDITFDIACYEPFEHQSNVDEFAAHGCTVHYVGRPGSKMLKQFAYYRNLKKLMSEQQYDVVHIHSDVGNKILVATKAAAASGVKGLVIHSHANGTQGNHRALRVAVHRITSRLLPTSRAQLVACSVDAADWMFSAEDAQRASIIRSGIDLEEFRFDPDRRKSVRAELGVDANYVVGHVGRFAHQKNHQYLLRVFQRIRQVRPDAKLLLVGEGPLRDEVELQTEELGIRDSVIFYGITNDVAGLYQAMDVFLLPSNHEGLGMVAVEAQAASLPVVLADCVPREAAMSDDVVFLPTTDEAMDEWAAKALELGEASRVDTLDEQASRAFDLHYVVDSLADIYKNMVRK